MELYLHLSSDVQSDNFTVLRFKIALIIIVTFNFPLWDVTTRLRNPVLDSITPCGLVCVCRNFRILSPYLLKLEKKSILVFWHELSQSCTWPAALKYSIWKLRNVGRHVDPDICCCVSPAHCPLSAVKAQSSCGNCVQLICVFCSWLHC